MQIVKSVEEINSLEENRIIGGENIVFKNSEIRFAGKGNILFCEKGVTLSDSQIKFFGDDCVIYLSSNSHLYTLDVTVYRNSAIYFGKNNYFNGSFHAIASERKNIIIGDGGIFSFGIWVRTSDTHLVYNADNNQRINPSKSILLGDHVWIGQDVMILKGSEIGSGSILGAKSLCSGKKIPSNTSWGGNPAKEIGKGVFWSSESVHNWTDAETEKHNVFSGKPFVYYYDKEEHISLSKIDKALEGNDAEKKLKYLKKLRKNTAQNRFAIPEMQEKKKRGKLWQR